LNEEGEEKKEKRREEKRRQYTIEPFSQKVPLSPVSSSLFFFSCPVLSYPVLSYP
jgi:hypothetical protein